MLKNVEKRHKTEQLTVTQPIQIRQKKSNTTCARANLTQGSQRDLNMEHKRHDTAHLTLQWP